PSCGRPTGPGGRAPAPGAPPAAASPRTCGTSAALEKKQGSPDRHRENPVGNHAFTGTGPPRRGRRWPRSQVVRALALVLVLVLIVLVQILVVVEVLVVEVLVEVVVEVLIVVEVLVVEVVVEVLVVEVVVEVVLLVVVLVLVLVLVIVVVLVAGERRPDRF